MARGLDIAYHRVCMCMREYKWGFGMDPRLWGEKPSQEEWERLTALVAGSPFRE